MWTITQQLLTVAPRHLASGGTLRFCNLYCRQNGGAPATYFLQQLLQSKDQFVCQKQRDLLEVRRRLPPLIRRTYADFKKENISLKVVEKSELIQNAIDKKREVLREKREDFIKDMRETKAKVRVKMEEIVERENVFTIPNLLCVGRAVMSPYLGYVIVQGDYKLALGLLVFASITDVLDGYIARTWPGQASKMGSFLDPMADKLLVGTLVISLTWCDLFPLWLAGFVLFRDIFLIAAGFVIRYISLPPPRTFSRYFDVSHATAQLEPTMISKINTLVQLFTIAVSLGAPIGQYTDHAMLHNLWYLTGVTTAAAALSYIMTKDTFRILKETKNQLKPQK